MKLPEVFPTMVRFLHLWAPAITSTPVLPRVPPRAPARSASWQEPGRGVPSGAPPRVAGPYKGKLACAPASVRFGEPGSRFRPRLLHIPKDRAGLRGMGHLGT